MYSIMEHMSDINMRPRSSILGKFLTRLFALLLLVVIVLAVIYFVDPGILSNLLSSDDGGIDCIGQWGTCGDVNGECKKTFTVDMPPSSGGQSCITLAKSTYPLATESEDGLITKKCTCEVGADGRRDNMKNCTRQLQCPKGNSDTTTGGDSDTTTGGDDIPVTKVMTSDNKIRTCQYKDLKSDSITECRLKKEAGRARVHLMLPARSGYEKCVDEAFAMIDGTDSMGEGFDGKKICRKQCACGPPSPNNDNKYKPPQPWDNVQRKDIGTDCEIDFTLTKSSKDWRALSCPEESGIYPRASCTAQIKETNKLNGRPNSEVAEKSMKGFTPKTSCENWCGTMTQSEIESIKGSKPTQNSEISTRKYRDPKWLLKFYPKLYDSKLYDSTKSSPENLMVGCKNQRERGPPEDNKMLKGTCPHEDPRATLRFGLNPDYTTLPNKDTKGYGQVALNWAIDNIDTGKNPPTLCNGNIVPALSEGHQKCEDVYFAQDDFRMGEVRGYCHGLYGKSGDKYNQCTGFPNGPIKEFGVTNRYQCKSDVKQCVLPNKVPIDEYSIVDASFKPESTERYNLSKPTHIGKQPLYPGGAILCAPKLYHPTHLTKYPGGIQPKKSLPKKHSYGIYSKEHWYD